MSPLASPTRVTNQSLRNVESLHIDKSLTNTQKHFTCNCIYIYTNYENVKISKYHSGYVNNSFSMYLNISPLGGVPHSYSMLTVLLPFYRCVDAL